MVPPKMGDQRSDSPRCSDRPLAEIVKRAVGTDTNLGHRADVRTRRLVQQTQLQRQPSRRCAWLI